jgi:hypothetical protein
MVSLQGLLVAVVGLLCVVNATVGLLLPHVLFLPFGLVVGVLKLGFGVLMLFSILLMAMVLYEKLCAKGLAPEA